MLSQPQLEHKVEVLTTNGKRPDAQAVIGKVGYTSAKLDAGAALLAAVKQGHAAVPAALQGQKQATQTEAAARQAAQKEMTSLAETSRRVFASDTPTLTALGLLTQHETVTQPDGTQSTVAVQPLKSTAQIISRWRSQLDVLGQFNAALLASLTEAGWPAERITAAKALVEAYAQADIDQQAAIQAHHAASGQQTAAVDALRDWYSLAAGLCKQAIKDADPHDHQQLMDLLEL